MVEDLARRFEVSAQTIRKDLNDLCDHRSLTRIHGGAIIASGVENLAYEARRFVAADEKKAIGAAPASSAANARSRKTGMKKLKMREAIRTMAMEMPATSAAR